MELKQDARKTAESAREVLIVPFMELKQDHAVLYVLIHGRVLIVPFMELKPW